MPTNNFKLFDENKANMMTDQEYNIAQQRLNGVQSGVASSQLQNKTLYQTALMCYALAQLMAANGYDANDADAVSTFVNNMSSSMVQKVVDKASSADLDAKTVGKWVDAAQLGVLKESVSNDYLKLAGGTMLGNLILNADPTQNLQAATKQYVDEKARFSTGSYLGDNSKTLSINLPFKPKIFMYTGAVDINSNRAIPFNYGNTYPIIIFPYDIPEDYPSVSVKDVGNNYVVLKYYFTNEGLTFNIEHGNYGILFNASGIKYYYCIFG